MYCVIQEIELKRQNQYGAYRELEVYKNEFLISGTEHISYSYRYTGDRFERPIRKAYKISIHQSFRENGKIKKKQYSVCTMGYYNIADGSTWIRDYMISSKWESLLEVIGINEEELMKLIYGKLEPLIEKVQKEFQQTEEYKVHSEHEAIIKAYLKAKSDFEEEYGKDTYDHYYDVFGALREPKKLEDLKKQQKQYKEYQRSYRENYQSNYNSYSGNSSYSNSSCSNYTDNEKAYLKKIYKAAAIKLHPDKTKGDDEGMKLLNRLKDEWGI